MYSIRHGIFETNSSSVSTIVIPEGTTYKIPSTVDIDTHNYETVKNTINDKATFLAYLAYEIGEYDAFIMYLEKLGIKVTGSRYDKKDNIYPLSGYFNSEKELLLALFGDESFIMDEDRNYRQPIDIPEDAKIIEINE